MSSIKELVDKAVETATAKKVQTGTGRILPKIRIDFLEKN